MSPTRKTGLACWSRSRSVAVIMPAGRPWSTTGRWWTLRRTSSSSASRASASGPMVVGSAVITVDTGSAGSAPAASTRVRRSRSVMMPTRRSPSVTSTEEMCSADISRAASTTASSARTVTGARRTRSPTRLCRTARSAPVTCCWRCRSTASRSTPARCSKNAANSGCPSTSSRNTAAGHPSTRVSSIAWTLTGCGPLVSAAPPMHVPAPPRSTRSPSGSRNSTAPDRTTSSSSGAAPSASTSVLRRWYPTLSREGREARTSAGRASNGAWSARKSRISASSTSRATGPSCPPRRGSPAPRPGSAGPDYVPMACTRPDS